MMKRLTKRCNGVVTYIGASNEYETGQIPCEVDPRGVRELLNLVAAYEDTGLTPEEVDTLKKGWSYLCRVVGECGGTSRIKDLVEADWDGRVVVLPCKVGDTVYRVITIKDQKPVMLETRVETLGQACDVARFIGKKHKVINIFLTREEAEKALEAKSND